MLFTRNPANPPTVPNLQVIPVTLTPVPVPNNAVAQNLSQLVALMAQYLGAQIQADISFFPTVASDPATNISPIIYNATQNVFKYWSTITGNYQAIGFLQVTQNPTTNQGVIFNTVSEQFLAWNGSSYVPIPLIPIVTSVPTTNTQGVIIYNQTNNAFLFWNGSAYVGISIYQAATDPTSNLGLFFNTATNLLKVWNPAIGSGQYSTAGYLPSLGDQKMSYTNADNLAAGWVLADGRTISGIGGLTATQSANLTGLFGATLPTVASVGSPAYYFLIFCGTSN